VLKDKYSDLAGYGARCLSIRLWAARDQPSMDLPEATEASRQARESDHIRVLLVEIGENISSSSAGDSASILKQLLQLKVESWLVASADPEAAQVHKHVNIGVLVCLLMAEKTEDLHGTPAIGPWVDQMPTRWKLH
jgi:microcystin degradation protein MlrC